MTSIVNVCGRSYDLSIRTEVERAVKLYQQNRDSVPGDIAARILAADHKIRGEPLMPEAFPPRVSLLFFDIDEKTFVQATRIVLITILVAVVVFFLIARICCKSEIHGALKINFTTNHNKGPN